MELLDHMVVLFLIIVRNHHTVSRRAALFHTPVKIFASEPTKDGTSEPSKGGSKDKCGEEVC